VVLFVIHSSVHKRDSWLILYNITGITDASVSKIRNLRFGLMNAEVGLNFQLTVARSFHADEVCIVLPILSTLTLPSLSLT